MKRTWEIKSEDFIGHKVQESGYWAKDRLHSIYTNKIINYKEYAIHIGHESCVIVNNNNNNIKVFNVYESEFYDIINNILIGFGRDTVEYYNLDTAELIRNQIR